MKTVHIANKEGCCKLLCKLKYIEEQIPKNSRKSYIPFADIFKKIGGCFCLRKEEIWNKLFLLKEFGLIEIIPFHGVVLKYRMIKNDKD